MDKDKRLELRLSDRERERLTLLAAISRRSRAEVLRELVKGAGLGDLPTGKGSQLSRAAERGSRGL